MEDLAELLKKKLSDQSDEAQNVKKAKLKNRIW